MSDYSDLKEVGKDAWNWTTEYAAPYVFGEKDITGTPTEPSNGHTEPAFIPEPGTTFDEPYKPTSGNKTFDKCLEFFL
jgi:hypothetical protein